MCKLTDRHCKNKKVLLHSKYSFCCPPGQGTPHPDLAGVPPVLIWLGYPHPDPAGVPPSPDLAGVPPRKDMGAVEVLWDGVGYPQKGHGTSRSIMGWRWGTPCV